MSLNVKTINVGGNDVTLRLTTKGLLNYSMKHGEAGQNPVLAVLSAIDNLEARIDLLTNALQYPGNRNNIKNGADLLDLMADDWSWGRDEINVLILELALESGLLTQENYTSLLEPVQHNGNRLIDTLAKLLGGKESLSEGADEAPEGAETEENPT